MDILPAILVNYVTKIILEQIIILLRKRFMIINLLYAIQIEKILM